jgi:TP901 family phage tail tape measure protein
METGVTKLTYTIQRENGVIEMLNYGYNNTTKTLVQYNSQQKQTITLAEKLSRAFKGKSVELMAYLGTYASFYKLFEALRQGIAVVHEVDTAFTDLRKVAQESDDVLRQFANTAAFDIAEGIGSTGRDIIDLTADFERLSYALEDAQELAKNTGVYMNVGDITDSQEAMQELVSTMKGFGLQAEDSTRIVDEFNEVGNRFAISSAGIGEALQRSSASLAQANNSLEQSIALAVAANDVIQNPEQVGSALKTVSLRIRGAKTELEEMGEETDGMATSVSKLREEMLALTKVDIMENNGKTFKSTYDILLEISKVWDKLSDVSQANVCLGVQKCA